MTTLASSIDTRHLLSRPPGSAPLLRGYRDLQGFILPPYVWEDVNFTVDYKLHLKFPYFT